MDDIVPGALQRLHEADIISMAGLAGASLGQEYCRIGAVQSTKRQGARLTGIVDVPDMGYKKAASPSIEAVEVEQATNLPGRYLVEVEARDHGSWSASCTCIRNQDLSPLCSHAAALLYQWLARPMDFLTPSPSSYRYSASMASATATSTKPILKKEVAELHPGSPPFRGAMPPGNLDETLALLGLNELRNIAREYDIAANGLGKQQLLEALSEVLKQPEMIRRAVGSLEKAQRQLLAALTLAGGSLSDDDLRSLFERFSLGTPSQLQGMLGALQSRALVFHTSVNSSFQQRLGLSGSLLDVGWHVPVEVRSALHVTLPVTPFDVEAGHDRESEGPHIEHIEPYSLLADLLLVARALDGYRLEAENIQNGPRLAGAPFTDQQFFGASQSIGQGLPPLAANTPARDGSIAIPPPGDMPSLSLLESLRALVPRTPAFLRFAIRLLRLADILYKEDSKMAYWHVLPNAARLLLGSTRAEVARELFSRWLTQATYEELFDLQESELQLRCRATPLKQPALRPGELEAENSEARQVLVRLLAQAPLNQWINFSTFVRFVYRLQPTFLQKQQRLFSTPHWWIELEEGRPLRPTHLNDWLRAEGRYLAQLIQMPLHWWGATDIALSDDGRLLAFRLTSMAGLLLNGIKFDEQTTASELPDYDSVPVLELTQTGDVLIACTSALWPLIELLENFAEVAGVSAGRLRYRLTPQSLGEALSHGLHPADLLEQLRRATENQNVGATVATDRDSIHDFLKTLEGRIANYGRARLYTGALLLEVADTQVRRELSATTSLDKQVVHAISPTLFILKKQGAEWLLEELKRRGQAPLLHEEESYGTE